MDALNAILARLARRHRLQWLIAICVPPLVASLLVASTWIVVVRTAWPAATWTVTAVAGAAFLIPLCWLPAVVRQRSATARLAAASGALKTPTATAGMRPVGCLPRGFPSPTASPCGVTA